MIATVQLLATALIDETDVFALRRDGRAIAEIAGLERQDQIRLATALSELGRDRLGCEEVTVRFGLTAEPTPVLEVTMRWSGGPTPAVDALRSARRLVRDLAEQSAAGRGVLVLRQPIVAPGERFAEIAARVGQQLTDRTAANREEDLRAQTRDLIVALEEARAHGEELKLVNAELEQTNAGVMALYAELSSELEQTNTGVVALHAELEDKSRLLRETSEAKTRFWANVSHELRGPLNSVIGLSRLLADARPDELGRQQREQVSLIAVSAETLRALVNELLDVAKAESGQLVPQLDEVDLGLLLAHLEAVMAPAIPHSGVTLEFPPPASVPGLVTDETMLIRVLRNLISNSLKFTEAGHVRVEVSAGAGNRQALEISVQDTGIGIPEEDQQRIFEEFYQVRGPHQRGKSGTGLGLPYARRLVELLGGELTLASAPGEGTRVTVRLPTAGSGNPPGAAATRLARLLTADDDPAFAAVLRPMLLQLAENVEQVGGGAALLESAHREPPSAIVVDLDMPEIDGYELVRRLADADDLAAIPVVVVTAFPPEQIERERLGHARAVLAKDGLAAGDLARALGLAAGTTGRP